MACISGILLCEMVCISDILICKRVILLYVLFRLIKGLENSCWASSYGMDLISHINACYEMRYSSMPSACVSSNVGTVHELNKQTKTTSGTK